MLLPLSAWPVARRHDDTAHTAGDAAVLSLDDGA
jgi:hypothetical protein